jgi:hypothetical protein
MVCAASGRTPVSTIAEPSSHSALVVTVKLLTPYVIDGDGRLRGEPRGQLQPRRGEALAVAAFSR